MILKEVLNKGIESLKTARIEAPAADAGVMLCHVLNCDRAYLYTHSEEIINTEKTDEFNDSIEKRCKGMPVQYITGHQEFMSLDFHVEPGVLIPRQDTEILVEAVIDICKNYDRPVKILDIGTGSGCISVSLAHYIGNCTIISVDISEKALSIARLNALNNKVDQRIKFIKSDLFSSISDNDFDIIVSNPPYICSDEINSLHREVKDYEPITALDGGNDGLFFYRSISANSPKFLRRKGYITFEVGYNQAEAVKELLKLNFKNITVVNDLANIERVVIGQVLC